MINLNDEKLPERIQELAFEKILARPENASCADCSAKGPRWVSLNFGVFICMRCSGAHRSLGPVYTKVRSVKLDNWTRDTLNIMEKIGNKIGNEYFESTLQKSYRKPDNNSSQFELEKYIHDKYVKRIYSPSNLMDPVTCFLEGKEIVQKSDAIKETPLLESKEIKQNLQPTKPLPPAKTPLLMSDQKNKKVELIDFTDDLVFDDFQSPPLESEFTDFHGPTDLAPHPKQNILDLYKEQQKEAVGPNAQNIQNIDSRNYNALNTAFLNNNYGNLNGLGMNYMSHQNLHHNQSFNYTGQNSLTNQQNMIGSSSNKINQPNSIGVQNYGQNNLMNQQNFIGQSNLVGHPNINIVGSQNLMGQQQNKGQPNFFSTPNGIPLKGEKAKNSGDIMALYAKKDDTALNTNEMQIKNGGKKDNMMGMYSAGSFNVW